MSPSSSSPLELEWRATIEGDWADGVTGLRGMRVEASSVYGDVAIIRAIQSP